MKSNLQQEGGGGDDETRGSKQCRKATYEGERCVYGGESNT